MKVNGFGQARILSLHEITAIFAELSLRDRTVFAFCLYAGCRISEAASIRMEDVSLGDRLLLLPSRSTKTRQSRTIPLNHELSAMVKEYLLASSIRRGFMFPHCYEKGYEKGYLARSTLHNSLQKVCRNLKMRGVSTHSFRRTCLTTMSNAGVPLHVIQAISGHSTLSALQKYLGVQPNQLFSAIDTISMKSSPAPSDSVFSGKFGF
jgi:integrase/recombinase XerD